MKNKFYKVENIKDWSSGMTVIELLVVLSIFTMVTTITIFNYGLFRSSASLQNLSDDIALSIRKAQSYAVGAYGLSSTFTYGYGMHFAVTNSGGVNPRAGTNKSFVLFTDISSDGIYNYDGTSSVCGSPTSVNECSELLQITSADQILNISSDISSSASAVDIIFHRPNLGATFCYQTNIGTCDPVSPSYVKIQISNGQTGSGMRTKTITVWNTGQISSL